ncbi:Spliceosome-associated protein 49 [Coemansia aciculifera]|uniref:Splicing factor 3B subunit 4 n=1 Tax=Coemansia aciculifera TaxID=417176 RepID=A0A9W8IMW5_9FUNG|nr:Spliceosome-associated protein 49 [Coemansia aciculifera]
MLIVHKVVEYLEGRRKNSFSLDIAKHNAKKTVLVPLLLVSERWRTAALESICDNCEISFDYARRAVEMDLPAWPADFSYPGFRKARHVKRVVVKVGFWRDMCDDTFTKTIVRPQYEGVAFPSANSLEIEMRQADNITYGYDYKAPTSQVKVVGLAHSLLQLVPAATGVVVKFISANSTVPDYMKLYGTLISELYQGRVNAIRIDSKLPGAPLVLNLSSTPGLTSIAHGPNVASASFACLAYLNAKTLKSTRINITTEADWRGFIYGGTTTPAIYTSLAELYLVINDTSYQMTWTAIEDIAPFPALNVLSVDGGYPFDDDLLFRDNGATLQYLHLPFSAIARNGLGRFNVLKRSGVTKMSRVSTGYVSDLDKSFMTVHPDVPISRQVRHMLEVAAQLKYATDTPGGLIFHALCAIPNMAVLQHLEFGQLWCAVDDIIKLLVVLPNLVSLSCGVCKLQAALEAIPVSERPSRLRAQYYPLSRNFRTLHVAYPSDTTTAEEIAYAAIVIAVLCPNFVQMDLPPEQRREFGREIAWAMNERNQEASVYIGNLDDRVTDELIWELMVQAGPVVNVHLPKDRVTQSTQGYGFCEFQSAEDADYAVKVMNMVKLYGKPMRVNKSANDRRLMDVGAKLFIGNLDPDVDEKLLFDTFAAFGPVVQNPKIARDASSGNSKGFAFVAYATFEAADAAIEAMNGQYLANKPVSVNYAFKKDAKGERHGSAAERLLAAQARKNDPTSVPPSTSAPGGW